MPRNNEVSSLELIARQSLMYHISGAITSLANGSYQALRSKSISLPNGKPGKSPIMVVPSKEVAKIKDYICSNLPRKHFQEMFHNILSKVVNNLLVGEKSKKPEQKENTYGTKITKLNDGVFYVFSSFILSGIEELDMTSVLHTSMKWTDMCRLSNMASNISYNKIEEIFLKALAEFSADFVNLYSFTWPHLISCSLIQIVGRHFKNLKELILACSCETGPFIEEERKDCEKNKNPQMDLVKSLEWLHQRTPGDYTDTKPQGCPKLRKIILPNIEDEKTAPKSVAMVIAGLPCLEQINGVSTLSSLRLLNENRKKKFKLNLKHLYDYDPLKKRLMSEVDFLEDLVPKIDNVNLRTSKDLTKRVMRIFPDLKVASIEWPDFHFYAKDFQSLVSLEISLDFQSPWHLLISLGRNCKSLKSLTIEHSTFHIDSDNAQKPSLPSLQYIKLVRSSFIEFVAFKTFIMGCPNINELYIMLTNDRNYMVDEFNDHLMKAVSPHLKNLEKFTAECLYKRNLYLHLNCILTMSTYFSLNKNCHNLKFVGHLDSWDVKDREVKDAILLARRNNWNLEIA